MEGPISNSRLLDRGRDSNIWTLVLINIIVAVAILIATVVIMMVEFHRGIVVAPTALGLDFILVLYSPP